MAEVDRTTSMPASLVVVTLALLLGVQPITTDLYLPALPRLTQELNASMVQAHLTLTALVMAFGVSQLVWGPLSDRFGRRPVLLAGLSAYVVASMGSAFSPNIEQLIAWRTVQGAAMGAGVMCARAIVRDLYTPTAAAHVMSKALTGLGLIACLSAPTGGLLTSWFNWHAALMALSVFGALSLALVATRFEETVPRKNPRALHLPTLARTWWHIVRNPVFVTFTALSAAAYSALFVFLAGSSFVFIQVLGLTPTDFGWIMFGNSLVYVCGTITCRRLLVRWGVRRTVMMAGGVTLLGGALMSTLAWMGFHTAWAIILPSALVVFAHGAHNPCGQSGAVGPFPEAAGTASALNGFLSMLCAFATGQWLGHTMDGTAAPLIQGIGFWSLIISLTSWTLVARYARP